MITLIPRRRSHLTRLFESKIFGVQIYPFPVLSDKNSVCDLTLKVIRSGLKAFDGPSRALHSKNYFPPSPKPEFVEARH